MYPLDLLDAARVNLRRPADAVQVNAAVILTRLQRFGTHAALADHRFDAVPLDDLGLVWLLADRGCRSRCDDAILLDRRDAGPNGWIFQHHRATMVDDAVLEDRQIAALAQIFVNFIAAGVDGAAEKHDVTGLEFAHVGFTERRMQRNRFLTACAEVEQLGFLAVIALELAGRLVQPFHYVALGVKDDAATAIGPAHVSDADKERRRQTIARPILQLPTVSLPPNPIGPMSSLLASSRIRASRVANSGTGFVSSNSRRSCS